MSPMQNLVIFEYLYRDAGNYKAFGQLLLAGECTPDAITTIADACESKEFFIAEQVSVPVLYESLYQLSGGSTEDDQAFHEFIDIRPATRADLSLTVWGNLETLISRFQNIGGKWNCALAPHRSIKV